MKTISKIIILLLPAAVLYSCTAMLQESSPAGLSVDSATLTVDADRALESDPFDDITLPVTDTLMVTSSRSWTVKVVTDDGGNWVNASVKEHIIANGREETVPLIFTFDRYRGIFDRTATAYLYAAGVETVAVPITQKAFAPELSVEAYSGTIGIPAAGGECCVIIRSNTSWTASIDMDKSTVMADISRLAGQDSKAVYVTFPANIDDERARTATLLVKASDCTPVSLEMIQNQSERFFRLDGEVPQVIEPYETSVHIPLKSNSPWSARLEECTFSGAELQPSSGTNALNGFTFTADHGTDPEVGEKKAVILISREGMEDIRVSFTQRGSIHLSFCSFNPEYEFDGRLNDPNNPYKPYMANAYPFSSPTSVPKAYSAGTYAGEPLDCVMKNSEYVFTMYGQDCGVWSELETYGWCVGKMQDDFVLFPAVDGKRLAAMYYEASCRAVTPYTVRTEDGTTIIEGGEFTETRQVVPVTSNHHDMHIHTFPSTVAGERYRLNLEGSFRMISIKDLCLVYE